MLDRPRYRTLDEPRKRISDTDPCPPPTEERDTVPVPQHVIDALIAESMLEGW